MKRAIIIGLALAMIATAAPLMADNGFSESKDITVNITVAKYAVINLPEDPQIKLDVSEPTGVSGIFGEGPHGENKGFLHISVLANFPYDLRWGSVNTVEIDGAHFAQISGANGTSVGVLAGMKAGHVTDGTGADPTWANWENSSEHFAVLSNLTPGITEDVTIAVQMPMSQTPDDVELALAGDYSGTLTVEILPQ